MTDRSSLSAVSPLDGRYAGYTEPLVPYASERALVCARVRVETEYLIRLADTVPAFDLSGEERAALRDCYESFDEDDAGIIKRLETEGWKGYAATNHDVKAVEYFVREHAPEPARPFVHFGLTSEDVNNLAQRLLVRGAVEEVLAPQLRELRDTLTGMARDHRDVAMLAHTHGQPATPTTFGKELAVYATRLGRAVAEIDRSADGLTGKLAGASGTYAAHAVAYPDIDWPAVSESFVESLGLAHRQRSTQVNPCDDLQSVFDALRNANNVLLDLDRDIWHYVSKRYLGQETVAGETGSSTMPHKVNPIDFENSEGNLSKANSDLVFLGDYITTSRLQRDLSDSTVKRNVGAAFAHCLVGYEKTSRGLAKITPNEQVMREELAATPEIIGEAVQTILRREGHDDAYERVKELTRGRQVTLAAFRELFDELDVDESVRAELHALEPTEYVGLASKLVGGLN